MNDTAGATADNAFYYCWSCGMRANSLFGGIFVCATSNGDDEDPAQISLTMRDTSTSRVVIPREMNGNHICMHEISVLDGHGRHITSCYLLSYNRLLSLWLRASRMARPAHTMFCWFFFVYFVAVVLFEWCFDAMSPCPHIPAAKWNNRRCVAFIHFVPSLLSVSSNIQWYGWKKGIRHTPEMHAMAIYNRDIWSVYEEIFKST